MWLEKNLWKSFMEYESKIKGVVRNHRMIVLCTYSLQKCTGKKVIEVIRNHESTLIRKENAWFPVERFWRDERNAIIGETAGLVGHNLRNPLQVIIGSLYLVKKCLNSTPHRDKSKQELEELLQTIELQVDYMNKIISDLEDYARVWIPQLIETNLKQLIENTLSAIPIPEKSLRGNRTGISQTNG